MLIRAIGYSKSRTGRYTRQTGHLRRRVRRAGTCTVLLRLPCTSSGRVHSYRGRRSTCSCQRRQRQSEIRNSVNRINASIFQAMGWGTTQDTINNADYWKTQVPPGIYWIQDSSLPSYGLLLNAFNYGNGTEAQLFHLLLGDLGNIYSRYCNWGEHIFSSWRKVQFIN